MFQTLKKQAKIQNFFERFKIRFKICQNLMKTKR